MRSTMPRAGHSASWAELDLTWFGTLSWGLSHFQEYKRFNFRNSYRYRKYHIYEVVKLNQIKLSNQFNCSESEKRFKAFIEHDLDWTFIAQLCFYDNLLLRDKRSGCLWDPLWGKSGLLYDCVWIVSDNQFWANPAPTLDESPGGSKFASRELALKLHLSFLICALRASFQLVASHESTSPTATLVHCYLSCC